MIGEMIMRAKGKNLFSILLLLFIIVPIVEVYILFQVVKVTNWWLTIALVIFTGVAGAYLAKREGREILRKISQDLSQGILPGEELINGLCVIIGGALLLTPGVVTDITGLTLIFPLTRSFYNRYFRSMLGRMINNGSVRVFNWSNNN
jgi:UPF0716 protein FxsA